MLIADKAYAHDPTVAGCAAAASLIPSRNGPTRSPAGPPRAAHGGRPLAFDKQIYRQRNVVERCFKGLDNGALATRNAKRAALYRSSLLLIAALIWLR
jgi:transposase